MIRNITNFYDIQIIALNQPDFIFADLDTNFNFIGLKKAFPNKL